MLVAFILIAGLFLRLINLNQSLWLDEAVQAITAKESLSYIFQEIRGDFHPPLYHFLMHFWVRIFGSSEIALRMPSVIFGVATVFVCYKLAMHVHGRFVAIMGAAFLATSQFHVYYSQEARMYSMTTFFATLSMFFFLKVVSAFSGSYQTVSVKLKAKNEKPKLKIPNYDCLWYFITTLCLIYSDYYGFLVLLAQMTYLLIKRKYKFLLICLFAYLLIYVPWLPMFITQIKAGMLATQMLPGWGRLVNVSFIKAIPLTIVKFSIGRIIIFDKKVYSMVLVGIIAFVGWIVGKGFFSSKFKVQSSKLQLKVKSYYAIIFLWFFVPLTVSWLASLFVPNYQPFRLLLILPAFYLLLIAGIQSQNDSMIQIIESGLILTINLISLFVYYSNPYFHREDWRRTVSFLKKQNAPAILPSETSGWPVKYYDPGQEMKVVYGSRGIDKVNQLTELRVSELTGNDLGHIFYIRYLVDLFDPNEKILAELGINGYTKAEEISFNQISLWRFEKK